MIENRPEGSLIAGVCAGAARAFGWNAWVLRALFVLFLLVETFWTVIVYAALAVLFHLGSQHRKRHRHEDEGLSSPELSERARRIEALEKRFQDLEKQGDA